jgi:hypothetical protein
MPTSAVVADTPNYVLMEANRRIGPQVLPLRSGVECSPIYGFSTTRTYDQFRTNSEDALTPYPLVKVYLRMRASDSGGDLKLVVVDAAGPREPRLHAATMEAVLEAQEKGTTQVNTEYELMFDQEEGAYRVLEACV